MVQKNLCMLLQFNGRCHKKFRFLRPNCIIDVIESSMTVIEFEDEI